MASHKTSLLIFTLFLITINVQGTLLKKKLRVHEDVVGEGYQIAAVTSGKELIDLFFINQNFGITQYTYNRSWTGTDLTNILASTFLHSGLSATAWNSSHIDLFMRSEMADAMRVSYDANALSNLLGGWSTWETLSGNISYNPAAAIRGKSQDVFVIGNDKNVYYKFWNFVWSNWLNIGGESASAPAAASVDQNRVDVFIRSPKDELMHKSWTKNLGWSEWKNRSAAGIVKSAPTAVASGDKRIDVFAKGPNSDVIHVSFNGEKWSEWGSLGGKATSAPTVIAKEDGKLMVFVRNQDRVLMENHFNGSKWSGWSTVAGGAIVIPDQ